MTGRLSRFVAASGGAALCCAIVAASLGLAARHVGGADTNGDGQPDVWRTYDHHGQLSEVAIDTNYDGRVDSREFYEQGALVRRESDRDFNDRVDLVQEFDPVTRQPIRTVADVDSDGVADLLVLFRNGKVVLSKWAAPRTPSTSIVPAAPTPGARHVAGSQLSPLLDPFLGDLSIRERQVPAPTGDAVILSASALPPTEPRTGAPCTAFATPETRASSLISEITSPRSTRGPPASRLFA